MPHLFRALLAATCLAPTAVAPAQHKHQSPVPAPQIQTAQIPESNRAMGQRLRSIYRSTDWKQDPNKTAERASYYDRLLREQKLSPADELTVRQQLSTELLRSGDPEAALQALDGTLDRAPDHAPNRAPDRAPGGTQSLADQLRLPTQARRDLLHQRAITFLRLGETENCLSHHGAHSCVFPIRAAGVHTLPRGAEGAVRDFTTLLQQDPSDDLARWLLNVAYMQLGRYPRDVPPKFLLPSKLFQSDRDLPEWPDMAALSGIDLTTRSGGAVVEDFDGDGLLDIVTSTSDPTGAMHLFHNNGDGTFSDRTAAAGLADELGGLNLVSTDYDNDGHPDLLVLRGAWWGRFGEYPLSLLHNRGDGTFEDVTVRAGLLTFGPTQTAAWADFDNDGNLDLFVGHENNPEADANPNPGTANSYAATGNPKAAANNGKTVTGNPSPAATNPNAPTHSSTAAANRPRAEHYPSQLFHNNGDGTFTDIARELGLSEQGFVKGVAWGDFNNDGRPDLYISTKTGENRLYRNDGPGLPSAASLSHPTQDLSFRPEATLFAAGAEKPAVLPSGTIPGAPFFRGSIAEGWAMRATRKPLSSHPTQDLSFRPEDAQLHRASVADKPAVSNQPLSSEPITNLSFRPERSGAEKPAVPREAPIAQSATPKPNITHWRFTDVTAQSGLAHQHNTFSTWFFDYDNDGWPDLFVAGYSAASMQDVGHFQLGHPAEAELPHLFHNNRNGTFTDVAHQLHLDRAILTMGANFGDLDNDGFLDLYLGTGEPSYEALLPNRLFRNNAGKRFEDVTTSTGLGHLQKGHGIAFADIENRGLEDIFELMGGAFPGDPYPSALYRNPLSEDVQLHRAPAVEKPAVLRSGTHPGAPFFRGSIAKGWAIRDTREPLSSASATYVPQTPTNHSITLKIEGTRTNRAAYGTRIDLLITEPAPNGKPTHRHIYRTVGSVSSFGGNPMAQHIGIGQATSVDEVHLRWPADPTHEQIFHDLPADQLYHLTESDPTPHPTPQPHFHLGDHMAPVPHHIP